MTYPELEIFYKGQPANLEAVKASILRKYDEWASSQKAALEAKLDATCGRASWYEAWYKHIDEAHLVHNNLDKELDAIEDYCLMYGDSSSKQPTFDGEI